MVKLLYLLLIGVLQIVWIAQSASGFLIYDPPLKEIKSMTMVPACEYKGDDATSYCHQQSVITKPWCPRNMTPTVTAGISGVTGNAPANAGTSDSYPITAMTAFAKPGARVNAPCSYINSAGNTIAGDPEKMCPDRDGNLTIWCGECYGTDPAGNYWLVFGQVADLNNETHNNVNVQVLSLCCPTGSPNCE